MRRSLIWLVVVGCGDSSVPAELVATSAEPPGANCPAGGVAITTGRDLDGDGVLEASEVATTAYVCTPVAPRELVAVVVEPPGPHCATGGQAIEIGLDANGNGILDLGEVTTTSYVCRGEHSLVAVVAAVRTARTVVRRSRPAPTRTAMASSIRTR